MLLGQVRRTLSSISFSAKRWAFYYGLGIIFMLGGVVAAYVKALQLRVGKEEKELSEYKLYVAERYASKEYLSETKREILDSIRDLARRIEHP
jgi:hypothetical protein